MPIMTEAMLKGFVDELSRKGDKHVAKVLNKILFQPDPPAQGRFADEGSASRLAPNPSGGADLGSGQSADVVGSSRIVTPDVGPGGA